MGQFFVAGPGAIPSLPPESPLQGRSHLAANQRNLLSLLSGCLMERLKSRKLWAAIVVFASATGLLIASMLTPDHWVDVVKWVGGFYLVGQGAADAAEKVAAKVS